MEHTIFYAWQSDLDQKTNRHFIKSCIEKAIKRLNQDGTVVTDAPRLEIDHDTKGIPGSPAILDSIFEKIDSSIAFIGDVSFIAQASGGAGTKHVSNPNVLFEMGYALNSVTDKRVILVFNTAYGDGTLLPFDLQHRRWPIAYKLESGANMELRKAVKVQLSDDLYNALKSIVGMPDTFNLSEDQEKLQLVSEQIWGISNLLLVRLRMYLMGTEVAARSPSSVAEYFGFNKSMGGEGGGCRLEAYNEEDMNVFWHNADLRAPSNLSSGGKRLNILQVLMSALSEAKTRSEDFLDRYSAFNIKATTQVTYLHNSVESTISILQMPGPKNNTQQHCMVGVCRDIKRAMDFVHDSRKQYKFGI